MGANLTFLHYWHADRLRVIAMGSLEVGLNPLTGFPQLPVLST